MVGVFTTNGPDPGFSPEERERRKRLQKWRGVLQSEQEQLVKVDQKLAELGRFEVAQKAYLDVRREQIVAQIERASTELEQLELVN